MSCSSKPGPDDESSPAVPGSPSDAGSAKWRFVKPGHGNVEYVQALSMLGVYMADAVPEKIQALAITPLGTDPQRDLLVGDFECQTKERHMLLSCKAIG